LKTSDPNHVLALHFRSRVEDGKGTPHILEHLVCCGSEKFPIRDPFMAMTKHSLNTFMNAWTGPDFIGFPFASANKKDFFNLLDVYLVHYSIHLC
jgi:Zn-dependent M16 (insulinase) family peptidase